MNLENIEIKGSVIWLKVMNDEMHSLKKNYNWELMRLAKKQNVFGCK